MLMCCWHDAGNVISCILHNRYKPSDDTIMTQEQKDIKRAKTAITKEMNALRTIISDMTAELTMQLPQPNGNIFYRGDVITWGDVKHLQDELCQFQLNYNQL
jgi:hypothetical protein